MPGQSHPDPVAAEFDAFEAAGWERAAPAYGEVLGQMTNQVVDRLLDSVGVSTGDRLLDLATGPGYVAGQAASRGAEVIGLDVTEAMLALATVNNPGVTFRRGDMHDLPFADDSFDVVVANFGILHAGRPDRVVTEVARVLRPGGGTAFTVWDTPASSLGFAVILDALTEAGAESPAEIPVGPPFFRYADDAEFRALLEGAGLADVEIATLSISQPVASADDWWLALLDGSVRTAALIRGQSDDTRAAVRRAFDRNFETLRVEDGYQIPMAVKLASARLRG